MYVYLEEILRIHDPIGKDMYVSSTESSDMTKYIAGTTTGINNDEDISQSLRLMYSW